tara:strand:- start:32533 stop:32706 length:174 start_codon:yes stop_codon:yes gene_type:complete
VFGASSWLMRQKYGGQLIMRWLVIACVACISIRVIGKWGWFLIMTDVFVNFMMMYFA